MSVVFWGAVLFLFFFFFFFKGEKMLLILPRIRIVLKWLHFGFRSRVHLKYNWCKAWFKCICSKSVYSQVFFYPVIKIFSKWQPGLGKDYQEGLFYCMSFCLPALVRPFQFNIWCASFYIQNPFSLSLSSSSYPCGWMFLQNLGEL